MTARTIRRSLVTVLSAGAVFAAAAAPASAGVLVESAPSCETPDSSQVFLPWVDLANYFRAPDGGFENGAAGWTLDNGAAVTDGNEPYGVAGDGGTHSLSLSNGQRATSPVVCVGIEHPTVRFFVRKNAGSLLSSLRVDVLVEDTLGIVSALPVATVGGSGSWQPTAPLVVTASLLPLLPGSHTPVAFRLVAQGGSWQVDDFYVDPTGRW